MNSSKTLHFLPLLIALVVSLPLCSAPLPGASGDDLYSISPGTIPDPDIVWSQRIPVVDEKITLSVTMEDNTKKTLVLLAEPIELAEERVGNCSCFEGEADWLPAAKRFEASGTVTVKGKTRELKIHYPGGHGPDHEHGQGDGNGYHDASD